MSAPANWQAWSERELTTLRTQYATCPKADLMAALPGRTWDTIQTRASKLGVYRINYWQPTEDELLRAFYPNASKADACAALPRRTWSGIQERAHKLGVERNVFWSAEDERLMRERYELLGPGRLAIQLNRSVESISHKAAHLGLRFVRPKSAPRSRAFIGPRLPKPPRVAKPKAVKPKAVPKPKPPKPARVLAVKRSAGTPVLNAAKEARRQSEEKPKRAAVITADEVRKLPYHHGGRMAYMLHGQAGWAQWQQQQPGS